MQSSMGGGGSLIKLASGLAISGVTAAAPQSVDLRNYAAVGEYSSFIFDAYQLSSSGVLTASANLVSQFLVDGVAGATAYGEFNGNNTAGVVFTATRFQIMDLAPSFAVTEGGFKIELKNLFANRKPYGINYGAYNKTSGASSLQGNAGGVFYRDVQAVHNGLNFFLDAADTDTVAFTLDIYGVR